MNLDDYNKKCGSCYMLGVLANRRMLSPIENLDDSGDIIANIEVISLEPKLIVDKINPIAESKYYLSIDNEQERISKPIDYNIKSQANKIEFWNKTLKDKIICFKPSFKKGTETENSIIKNIKIENIEDHDIKILNDEYVPVPTLEMSTEEFEKKLKQGTSINLKNYNHSMYQPEYIICDEYIYFNFQLWDKDPNKFNNWICSKEADKIEKIKIKINDIDHIVAANNLIFMRRSRLMNIEDESSVVMIFDGLLEDEKIEILEKNEDAIQNESEFLDDLKKETLKLGLSYSRDDLVNLHTCVKTNPLTILSGMSGTGKSKIASVYSNVLNCNEDNDNLLFLPINPSYTEPGDLLGYLNNVTGIYTASDTRLVDFLNQASKAKDKMHIVIFDEMNLSQVEYWFAPFISLLEREPGKRNLELYNPGANCINKSQYPHSIHIGDNVRFIGTVNIDETTKNFSDRLLDRANIIILEKQSFAKLKEEILEFNEEKHKQESYNKYEENNRLYLEWINKDKWIESYSDKEIQFFDELHEIINKYDTQKGVSFRIIKKIGEFLNNIPIDRNNELLLARSKALDLQVNQRIITKIKGTEQQFGKLIGTISSYGSDEIIDSELAQFFSKEEWKEISDFKLTKKEINRKAKELGVYGYAD